MALLSKLDNRALEEVVSSKKITRNSQVQITSNLLSMLIFYYYNKQLLLKENIGMNQAIDQEPGSDV